MEWRGQAIFVWCFAQRQMARRSNRLHYFGHICIQWYDATGAWCRASWGRAIAGRAASTQSRWPASPTHRRRVAAMDEHDWRTGAAILANRVPWGNFLSDFDGAHETAMSPRGSARLAFNVR